MHSFAELARYDGHDFVPNQMQYLRELLSYDMLCEHSCKLERTPHTGQIAFRDAPSPLHWSRQLEWPWALHHAELTDKEFCLDVGSGWGVFKYALAKRCADVYAFDNDKSSLDKAWETTKKLGLRHKINYWDRDARDNKFQSGVFDRVFCLSVLEHIPDGHEKVLSECMRVLKPGGALLLTADFKFQEGDRIDDFYSSMESLIRLLEKFNFPFPEHNQDAILGTMIEGTRLAVYMARVVKQ